ncbi:hypothetical protein ABW20_dc0101328 [Dactylellina cionopaga]|nr:hypothetical protein ABW20_dc0101328 [Dactylellina cionopaga]
MESPNPSIEEQQKKHSLGLDDKHNMPGDAQISPSDENKLESCAADLLRPEHIVLPIHPEDSFSIPQGSSDADVTVFAGLEKEIFKMHRADLTTNSQYFKAALEGRFEESRTREIHLEEIEPEIFELVATWMDGSGYKELKHDNYNRKTIVNTYIAADYLQLFKMKTDILMAVASFWRREQDYSLDSRKERDPYQMLQNLCAHSQPSQWSDLRECAKFAIQGWFISQEELLSYSKEDPGDGSAFMLSLVIEFFQNALHSLLCYTCQSSFKAEGERQCKNCCRRCPKLVTVSIKHFK